MKRLQVIILCISVLALSACSSTDSVADDSSAIINANVDQTDDSETWHKGWGEKPATTREWGGIIVQSTIEHGDLETIYVHTTFKPEDIVFEKNDPVYFSTYQELFGPNIEILEGFYKTPRVHGTLTEPADEDAILNVELVPHEDGMYIDRSFLSLNMERKEFSNTLTDITKLDEFKYTAQIDGEYVVIEGIYFGEDKNGFSTSESDYQDWSQFKSR